MKYAPAAGLMAPFHVSHPADPSLRQDARRQPDGHVASEPKNDSDTTSGDASPSDVGWVVVIDEEGRHCLWPASQPLPEGCRLSDGLEPDAPSGGG